MKALVQNCTLFSFFFFSLLFYLSAQDGNKQVITDQMTGHIFRAKQVDVTPARLQQIQAPDGFTVTRLPPG